MVLFDLGFKKNLTDEEKKAEVARLAAEAYLESNGYPGPVGSGSAVTLRPNVRSLFAISSL